MASSRHSRVVSISSCARGVTLPTGTVIARVADEAVEDRAEVEADDVAFLQLGAVRDAVHDHVIDRRCRRPPDTAAIPSERSL